MRKKKNEDDRYFRISSLYPAAFLFAKGMELVSVDKITNPRKAQFVFRNHPNCENWINAFHFGKEDSSEVMVDGRKFTNSIKALKDQLYQESF